MPTQVQEAVLTVLDATTTPGTITIESVDQEAGKVTISGFGSGWTASTDSNGTSTIVIRTAASNYPASFMLQLSLGPTVADRFQFAPVAGQISMIDGDIQSCGFLLLPPNPALNMFVTDPPETASVSYNLQLFFVALIDGSRVVIHDPTIVFDPPTN
jgi:hypothetical protein